MDVTWTGIMPALMTEMKQDGTLDHEATSRHIEFCLEGGVTGFVMLGTLGENSSLSQDEKAAVIENALQTVKGRVPVLAGTAEYTTQQAIDYSRRMETLGADGLMVLPSMVYEQDQREGVTHFKAIANATGLPIMVYNNRVSYKLDLSPASFAELAECENIVAVKESSHDSRRLTDMINVVGDRYKIFCGVDDLALENALFGADGWVSGMANPFPQECVELFALAKAGKVDEAVALYRWFMPLLHLDVHVKLVQYIKLANQMVGVGSEALRAPRLPLVGDERAAVEAVIREGLASRPTFNGASK